MREMCVWNFFKSADHASAAGKYEEALGRLGEIEALDEEMNKLMVILCQNLSVCLNAQGNHNDAKMHCSRALDVNPSAFKAGKIDGL